AQGRVQRFWQGRTAPPGARPAWLVLGALAVALEDRGEAPPRTAAEAFARIARDTEALQGLTYEALGTAGAPVREAAPA
ncbi:MAG: hypothetical protein HKO53_02110, partial [Gemmatimonadetes bacterium]|nr:hypothetical protein [Gemmatimonadota bacterium]